MRFSYRLGVIMAVVAGVALCVSALPKQEPQEVAINKDSTRIGGLLDFANYKKLFNKSYSSLLEEAVRLKHFTASALRTATAAIKYRFRLINHYLSLNQMSDWTREEFERLENKALAMWAKSFGKHNSRQSPVPPPESSAPKLVPDTIENVAEEARELVEEHKGEPAYDQLGELLGAKGAGQHERRKRETGEDKPLPPRELPIEKLIHAGEAKISPDGWDDHRLNVQSNNPLFEPAELSTRGFADYYQPVVWHSYESNAKEIEQLGTLSTMDLKNFQRILEDEADLIRPWALDDKPDEVFVDLRETGCISPVRRQHKCGACYAFTTIAIMEFLYCMNTGKKVAFSEQYMIDCGRHAHMNGCEGGAPILIPEFLNNFGLYPRALYPYQMRTNECPYDEESVILEQTGYIRSDNLANSLMISREHWGEALKHGPLLITVVGRPGSDLQAYGGGVLLTYCSGEPGHGIVLVGHGRANGREYWLIRNSWGSDWGEDGYARIDKECNCIKSEFGFAYGVSSPEQFGQMTFVDNEKTVPINVESEPRDEANAAHLAYDFLV